MAIKIAFINNKGGSAKTTTVVNLAGAISKEYPNKKILIVEGDAQGNASTSFKINSSKIKDTIYDVFIGNREAENVIVNAFKNIDIIPANTDMNFLEFDVMERYDRQQDRIMYDFISDLTNRDVDFKQLTYEQFVQNRPNVMNPTNNYFNMLEGKVGVIDSLYDIILFDTPPELKAVTSSVLAIADKAIIPFEPDTYSVHGIMNILSRINSIQKDYNPNLEVAGILATKVQKRTKAHTDVMNEVMKFCMKNNLRYLLTEIPRSIRFVDATVFQGFPATLVSPENSFTQSYYELLDELLDSKIIDWEVWLNG